MGRLEENPVPPQPIQTPPPEGYPNQYDNPLTSQEPVATPSQQPPAAAYPQPVVYPPPPAAYQQPTEAIYAQPAVYPPPAAYQQPHAATYAQPATNSQLPTTAYAQPVTTGTPMNTQGEWSTGLCDCFDDPGNAIKTCFCPCVTFGQIAEIVDNGESSCGSCGLIYSLVLICTASCFIPCPCLVSCWYRTKIRGRYNLHETPAPDCMVHFFCECCALCQEYRELKNRDMDPALGWQGNLSKHQQMANVATMTPPVNERMMG